MVGRNDEATQRANLAMALRPNDAFVMYNAACMFCGMGQKADGLSALVKANAAGFTDGNWARRDPDLAILHGDPEFERIFPPVPGVS